MHGQQNIKKHYIFDILIKTHYAYAALPGYQSIQTLQAILSQETLRMVYFAYVHSIMSYGIILGGNQPHSEKIF
jgi:hypothetical protein